MGHTLIMGRRTYESLRGRRLRGRRLIVLTRKREGTFPAADAVAHSLEQALQLSRDGFGEEEVFIAGGGEVYAQALEADRVDRMYLTIVEANVKADTFFPPFDEEDWQVLRQEHHPADERNPYPFTFKVLERRP